MLEKTIKVYKFEELSKDAQDKVMQIFSENHSDFLTEDLDGNFKYQLKENYPFFENPKFKWSLSYYQGDGLSFSCDINLSKYLDIYHPKMPKYKKWGLCEAVYNLKSKGNTGNYYYFSERGIDYKYNYQDHERKHLYDLLENIVNEIRVKYIEVCKDFEKEGYDSYEYIGTKEYAIDECEANEYTFRENGDMENI